MEEKRDQAEKVETHHEAYLRKEKVRKEMATAEAEAADVEAQIAALGLPGPPPQTAEAQVVELHFAVLGTGGPPGASSVELLEVLESWWER